MVVVLAEPEPKIQYAKKAIAGSLPAVLGLSNMIEDTIHLMVSDMLLWSHKHVIKLGVNADTSDLELKHQGMEEGRSGIDAGLVGSA